jgi:uncharacterized membrane protein YdjX (TVP38/TMEM64 family)
LLFDDRQEGPTAENGMTKPDPYTSFWRLPRMWISAALLLLLGAVALRFGEPVMALLRDPARLQALVVQMGWYGPLALIAVNIVQIVLAPIPGYAVYLIAGVLYGPWWGGVWGSVGLMSGGMVAMGFGRIFGRPLVQALIGRERLHQLEDSVRSDTTLVWAAIMLSPVGDAPFLLAGLTRVSFGKIAVLTLITRVPAAFVAAAIGAGAVHLNWWQLSLVIALLGGPLLLVNRYQGRIAAWLGSVFRPK